MLKYITKIAMDIFPSVLATIIGAYIVNHYINAKPAGDTPAMVAPATGKADGRKDGKPADQANLPAPGIKAKGISEKAVLDKPAGEKTSDQAAEGKSPENKSSESKSAESKAEPASPESAAAASPRTRSAARDGKAIAKSAPSPSVAAPQTTSAAIEPTPTAAPDATDLARAAIERLRKSPDAPAQETARAPETQRAQETSHLAIATPPGVKPLPPPINVSIPGAETYGSQAAPPYTASVRSDDDANRLTPPADIPVPIVVAPPLDLRADAGGPLPHGKANVAEEMLSGVKSMFHAVLPKGATPD